MGKPWVQLMLFVSVLLLPFSSVSARDVPEELLTIDELKNPEFVVNWLKAKSGSADKKRAMWFYEFGLKSKQQGHWGPAGKAFGESMLRYPSPHALTEYINAALHVYGPARIREKTVNRYKRKDMIKAQAFYRSAFAANSVTNTLSAKEKEQILDNIECLDRFIRSGKVQPTCRPLQSYGLTK